MELAGKIAVVTAAGSGIGRASAVAMAAKGARLVVSDLRLESAQATVEIITGTGGEALAIKMDAESPDEIRATIAEAVNKFGGIDILHNNAALLDPEYGQRDHSLLTIDVEAWDRFLAVNLRSVMLGCQTAIPHLIKRGGGSIINTSSILGLRGDMQLPAYSASKAAIVGLSRQVAAEFGRNGIRCNAIAPGVILTPLVDRFLPEHLRQLNVEACSTPYLGQAEDIGAMAAFLASDSARFITGQVIAVDGGATTQLATVAGYQRFHDAHKA